MTPNAINIITTSIIISIFLISCTEDEIEDVNQPPSINKEMVSSGEVKGRSGEEKIYIVHNIIAQTTTQGYVPPNILTWDKFLCSLLVNSDSVIIAESQEIYGDHLFYPINECSEESIGTSLKLKTISVLSGEDVPAEVVVSLLYPLHDRTEFPMPFSEKGDIAIFGVRRLSEIWPGDEWVVTAAYRVYLDGGDELIQSGRSPFQIDNFKSAHTIFSGAVEGLDERCKDSISLDDNSFCRGCFVCPESSQDDSQNNTDIDEATIDCSDTEQNDHECCLNDELPCP